MTRLNQNTELPCPSEARPLNKWLEYGYSRRRTGKSGPFRRCPAPTSREHLPRGYMVATQVFTDKVEKSESEVVESVK